MKSLWLGRVLESTTVIEATALPPGDPRKRPDQAIFGAAIDQVAYTSGQCVFSVAQRALGDEQGQGVRQLTSDSTLANREIGRSEETSYFRTLASVMAIVGVAGFVMQLALGRSSFGAPLIVHLHAVAFMGWVLIFAAQPWLANTGAMKMHRLLGLVAVFWACGLLVLGCLVTWAAVQTGRTPFFLQPQHFLIANPAILLAALGLLAAAVLLRRCPDWHTRLQIGSFVMLMGPSFGRLLPMPLLMPYAFEIAALAPLVFVAFAAGRDAWVRKRVHPAWIWTTGVLLVSLAIARLAADSDIASALYAAAVAGTGAAGGDGMAFPPPPPMP